MMKIDPICFATVKKIMIIRNYRISEIEEVWFTNENIEIKDKKYIDDVYKNFDPFLSYKNTVKVEFTEKGVELYEKVLTNRPRLLNKKDGIYTFECDNKLALVYFAQFFSNVKILEPIELQKKLKNELKRTIEIYENKEEENVSIKREQKKKNRGNYQKIFKKLCSK